MSTPSQPPVPASATATSTTSMSILPAGSARARLVEVKAEIADLHTQMAAMKDDLQMMTQTYMEEMQTLLMQTLEQAMNQQQQQEAVTQHDDQADTSAASKPSQSQ